MKNTKRIKVHHHQYINMISINQSIQYNTINHQYILRIKADMQCFISGKYLVSPLNSMKLSKSANKRSDLLICVPNICMGNANQHSLIFMQVHTIFPKRI